MPGPFDPNNILQGIEQKIKEVADGEIDNLASKVPGGQQFDQQAKDAVNSGIDQAGQTGMQDAEQQANQHLGGAGGLGQMLGGLLGGHGSDPNAGQGSNS